MRILKNLLIIFIIFFVSCGEIQKKEETKDIDTPQIDGFWERKGTIQFVNGKPVDTLFYGIDEDGMKNIKVYSNDNVFWINNFSDKNNPWPGGMGGYGKFEINSDTLTEYMSHGSGTFGAQMHYLKDSLNTDSVKFPFAYILSENTYTQLGGAVPDADQNISYGEYYEKLPSLRKSKLDGVWKRAYEISYVNGVAIDTTSVPSDAILDVKVIKDGYFLVQVDQTNLIKDPTKREYGGGGAFGQIDYEQKDNMSGNMSEFFEFNGGQWPPIDNKPRDAQTAHYASVSFYDDDMYLQITKDTLDRVNSQAGRGVVYKRVE
tara:strand:+ start:1277 stop:2230 length:954 start_codon:yes stop_codon:yes gene_type:complete